MSSEIVKSNNQVQQFNFFDNEQFATMQRISTMFANSELVPDMYRIIPDKNPKEKAIANCMIAIECAQRIGASVLMVMQNMVIIYGRPSWSSKFLIATVNTCGRFKQLKYKFENLGKVGKVEIIEYQWNGQEKKKVPVKTIFDGSAIDNLKCVAYTTENGSDEVLESSEVTIDIAIREGWYQKSGSKWPTMTKKMLIYRAASFWTNEYAPELSMGMKTAEEMTDIEDISYDDITDRTKKEIKEKANKTEMKMDPVEEAKQVVSETKDPAVESVTTEENPI